MDETGPTLLDVLSRDDGAAPKGGLSDVWQAYRSERALGSTPFEAAVNVAATVDRLGFAFAVGYPAALEQMVTGVALPCALCVTEAKGNSPRAIETTLERRGDRFELRGTKTFVTFGNLAETLLIVARVGAKPDGRPDLVVVQVPAARKGVVLQELARDALRAGGPSHECPARWGRGARERTIAGRWLPQLREALPDHRGHPCRGGHAGVSRGLGPSNASISDADR